MYRRSHDNGAVQLGEARRRRRKKLVQQLPLMSPTLPPLPPPPPPSPERKKMLWSPHPKPLQNETLL